MVPDTQDTNLLPFMPLWQKSSRLAPRSSNMSQLRDSGKRSQAFFELSGLGQLSAASAIHFIQASLLAATLEFSFLYVFRDPPVLPYPY